MKELSQLDLEKIKLITATVQVNDLISLLMNINENDLLQSIESVLPEDKNTEMYRLLVAALNFYKCVGVIVKNTKTESINSVDKSQLIFEF